MPVAVPWVGRIRRRVRARTKAPLVPPVPPTSYSPQTTQTIPNDHLCGRWYGRSRISCRHRHRGRAGSPHAVRCRGNRTRIAWQRRRPGSRYRSRGQASGWSAALCGSGAGREAEGRSQAGCAASRPARCRAASPGRPAPQGTVRHTAADRHGDASRLWLVVERVQLPERAVGQGKRLESRCLQPLIGRVRNPQALPGSKMAAAGPDWATNAATQIRWGLGYIQASYGSPCGAWAHETSSGWY